MGDGVAKENDGDGSGETEGGSEDEEKSLASIETDSEVSDEEEADEGPEEMGREHPDSVPKDGPSPDNVAAGTVKGMQGMLEALLLGSHKELNLDAVRGAHDLLQHALKPGQPAPKVVPPPPPPKPEKLVSIGKTRKVTEEILDIYKRAYTSVLGIDPETLGKRARNAALGDFEVHECLDVFHDGESEVYSAADPHRLEKRFMQLALELKKEMSPEPVPEPEPAPEPKPEPDAPRKRLNAIVCEAYMEVKGLKKPPKRETVLNNLKKVISHQDVKDKLDEHGNERKWYDVAGEENIEYVGKRAVEILSGKAAEEEKPAQLPQLYQLVQEEYREITGLEISWQKAARIAGRYKARRGVKGRTKPAKGKAGEICVARSIEDIPALRESISKRLRKEPDVLALLEPEPVEEEPAPEPEKAPPAPDAQRTKLNPIVCEAYMRAKGLSKPPTRETIRTKMQKVLSHKDVRDRVDEHGNERKWYDVAGKEDTDYVKMRSFEIISGKAEAQPPEPAKKKAKKKKKTGNPAAKPQPQGAKSGGKKTPLWVMPTIRYLETRFPIMYENCKTAADKRSRSVALEADLYRMGYLTEQQHEFEGTARWVDTRDENLEEYLGDILFGRWAGEGEGGQLQSSMGNGESTAENSKSEPYIPKGPIDSRIYSDTLDGCNAAFQAMETTQGLNPGYEINKISGECTGKSPLVISLADGECEEEGSEAFAAKTFRECIYRAAAECNIKGKFRVECSGSKVSIVPCSRESAALLKAFQGCVLEQGTDE